MSFLASHGIRTLYLTRPTPAAFSSTWHKTAKTGGVLNLLYIHGVQIEVHRYGPTVLSAACVFLACQNRIFHAQYGSKPRDFPPECMDRALLSRVSYKNFAGNCFARAAVSASAIT